MAADRGQRVSNSSDSVEWQCFFFGITGRPDKGMTPGPSGLQDKWPLARLTIWSILLHPVLCSAPPGYYPLAGCLQTPSSIALRHNVSRVQCAESCSQVFGCVAFEYGFDTDPDSGTHSLRDCQLHASQPHSEGCPDVSRNVELWVRDSSPLSGYVHSPDPRKCVDQQYNLGTSHTVPVPQCADLCMRTGGCVAFQHRVPVPEAIIDGTPADCQLQRSTRLTQCAAPYATRQYVRDVARYCAGYISSGGNVPGLPKRDDMTPTEAVEVCQNLPDCVGVTWVGSLDMNRATTVWLKTKWDCYDNPEWHSFRMAAEEWGATGNQEWDMGSSGEWDMLDPFLDRIDLHVPSVYKKVVTVLVFVVCFALNTCLAKWRCGRAIAEVFYADECSPARCIQWLVAMLIMAFTIAVPYAIGGFALGVVAAAPYCIAGRKFCLARRRGGAVCCQWLLPGRRPRRPHAPAAAWPVPPVIRASLEMEDRVPSPSQPPRPAPGGVALDVGAEGESSDTETLALAHSYNVHDPQGDGPGPREAEAAGAWAGAAPQPPRNPPPRLNPGARPGGRAFHRPSDVPLDDPVSEPSSLYSAPDPLVQLRSGLDCCICLEPYKDEVLAPCSHSFCSACITAFLRTNPPDNSGPCPICRTEIRLSALRCVTRERELLTAAMARQRAATAVPDAAALEHAESLQRSDSGASLTQEVLFVDVQTRVPGPRPDVFDGELLTQAVVRQSFSDPTDVTAAGHLGGGRWVAAFHVKLIGAPLPGTVFLQLSLVLTAPPAPAATRTVDMVRVLPLDEWRHLVIGLVDVPPGGAQFEARLTAEEHASRAWYASLLIDCLVLRRVDADPDLVFDALIAFGESEPQHAAADLSASILSDSASAAAADRSLSGDGAPPALVAAASGLSADPSSATSESD